MHMLKFLALPLALLLALTACNSQPATGAAAVKKIDVPAARALLSSDQRADLQLIDLRTPEEVAATGIIPGARVIDFVAPDFKDKVATLDKQKPVVVYCAAGGRSGRAAAQLHDQGFTTVYDIAPGMNGWLEAGEKTEKQ